MKSSALLYPAQRVGSSFLSIAEGYPTRWVGYTHHITRFLIHHPPQIATPPSD